MTQAKSPPRGLSPTAVAAATVKRIQSYEVADWELSSTRSLVLRCVKCRTCIFCNEERQSVSGSIGVKGSMCGVASLCSAHQDLINSSVSLASESFQYIRSSKSVTYTAGREGCELRIAASQ